MKSFYYENENVAVANLLILFILATMRLLWPKRNTAFEFCAEQLALLYSHDILLMVTYMWHAHISGVSPSTVCKPQIKVDAGMCSSEKGAQHSDLRRIDTLNFPKASLLKSFIVVLPIWFSMEQNFINNLAHYLYHQLTRKLNPTLPLIMDIVLLALVVKRHECARCV